MVSPLLVIAGFLTAAAVADDPVSVFSMVHVEEWQRASTMKLSINPPDEGSAVPLSYDIIPLTANLGLNQTDVVRGAVHIRGTMREATAATYVNLTTGDSVAYLCCDDMSDSNITPTMMMTTLMLNRPKAIILYSTNGSCCGISTSDPPYKTIFTMASSAEAGETLNWTTRGNGLVQATITGNVSSSSDPQDGSNSAVAMSILYSITGLITLLFLVIIATGAIRAHRYPERYGPRSGYGGRPRQSRAKGIARAVLETLPIVKFGESNPPKPDPSMELENSAREQTHDINMGTRLSAIPEEPQSQQQPRTALPTVREAAGTPDAHSVPGGDAPPGSSNAEPIGDEHLGCSICTEDFSVGEDVRVLPCDHKFHPACVDPWLMNVSGTCPLCRLDLRPPEEQDSVVMQDDLLQVPLPPPLDPNGSDHHSDNESGSHSNSQARRSSRLLDLHRLRHASVEERMDILRRHVSQPQNTVSMAEGDSEERGRRARLADRLRDKFRIHTRTQSP